MNMFSVDVSTLKVGQFHFTPLHTNSAFLILQKAGTAAFGSIFLVVAARLFTTNDVGMASALIAAIALLSFAARLGLGEGLIRFLPGAKRESFRLINSSLTLSALLSFLFAGLFLVSIRFSLPDLAFIQKDYIAIIIFSVSVFAATLSALVENVFIALRRAEFAMLHGLVLSILRLIVLVVIGSSIGFLGIFSAWGLPAIVSSAIALMIILPFLLKGYRPSPLLKTMKSEHIQFSFTNYISEGLRDAPAWILPLLVFNMLGGTQNAYFFAAWAIGSRLFLIPISVATSLFAEGSHDEEILAQSVIKSIKLCAVLLVPSVAVILFAGKFILLLFGTEYSEEGHVLLWILALSSLPVAVNAIFLSIARVQKRYKSIILIPAAITVLTFTMSYLMIPSLGLKGIGISLLASHATVAIVSVINIYKTMKTAQPKKVLTPV